MLCEFWYVIFYSFDRKNILRIELLPKQTELLRPLASERSRLGA